MGVRVGRHPATNLWDISKNAQENSTFCGNQHYAEKNDPKNRFYGGWNCVSLSKIK